MTIGITFFHIKKIKFQNTVSIWISYFYSVKIHFQFPFSRKRVHSKIKRWMERQLFACRMWLLNSFISNVSGYHQLTQPKMSFLLNKYALLKMYYKKCSEWVGFVCTTFLETKSKSIRFLYLHMSFWNHVIYTII